MAFCLGLLYTAGQAVNQGTCFHLGHPQTGQLSGTAGKRHGHDRTTGVFTAGARLNNFQYIPQS